MDNTGYVIAGYLVTLAAISGYLWRLVVRGRRARARVAALSQQLALAALRPDEDDFVPVLREFLSPVLKSGIDIGPQKLGDRAVDGLGILDAIYKTLQSLLEI